MIQYYPYFLQLLLIVQRESLFRIYILYILHMETAKVRPYLSSENWSEINGLRQAGETFDDAVTRLLEERKKQRLHADMLSDRKEDDYIPLESIPEVKAIMKERKLAGTD